MTVVVDSSVAFKWFVADEPHAAEAAVLLQNESALLAPDLLVAEVCNSAWRAVRLGRIPSRQADYIATAVPRLFAVLAEAASLAARAVTIAVQLDHPVYDCLYLALAEARQAPLVTADDRLLAKLRGTQWDAAVLALADYRPQG